jgi:hypothetical protein
MSEEIKNEAKSDEVGKKEEKNKSKGRNWKKIIISIVIFYALLYTLLFSKLGNSLVKSNIEFLLNTDSEYQIELTEFVMDTERFYMVGDVDRGAMTFTIDYIYDNEKGKYILAVKDISKLDGVYKSMKGGFKTRGTIKKIDDEKILLNGSINDMSDVTYEIIANINGANFWAFDFNVGVKSVDFKLNPISLSKIMQVSGEEAPIDASVLISGSVIDPISQDAMQKVNIKLLDGVIKTDGLDLGDLDASSIPKDFTFSSNIDMKIIGDDATISGEFLSTMINIYTKKAKVDMVSEVFDADYKIVLNLDSLKVEGGEKLTGNISTTGKAKGKSSNYKVNGKSALYGSDTTYSFQVVRDITKDLKIHIKNASLKEMAKVAGEETDVEGKINTIINIKNTQAGQLDGVIISTLNDVVMSQDEMQKKYNVNVQEDMKLEMRSETTLKGNMAYFKSIMNFGVAKFKMYNAQMNLDTEEFAGKYKLILGDFSKIKLQNGLENDLPLEILNNTKPLILNGNIQTLGDELEITGRAKLLDGKFKFKYFEDILNVKFNQVANTDVDLNVDYNSLSKRTLANLYVSSEDSTMVIKNAKFNANTGALNSKIELESMGKRIVYTIKGDTENPKIMIKTYSPLITKKFSSKMKEKIASVIDDATARAKLNKLLSFMSRKNATFTNKDFIETSDALSLFVDKIRDDVEKTMQYEGTGLDEEGLEKLHSVVTTLNDKHQFLSKEDIEELKGVIAEISSEFEKDLDSPYYQDEKRNALETLHKVALSLKDGGDISDSEIQIYIDELNSITDEFQMYLSDRNKINEVLEQFKSVEKFGDILGADVVINDKHVLKMIDEFNILIDYFQHELNRKSNIKKARYMVKRIGHDLEKDVKKEIEKAKE